MMLCCLSLPGCPGYAQNTSAWQVLPFTGQFITRKDRELISQSYHYGASVDFFKKTTGKKYWQYAHNYPNMGLSATWRTLGSRQVFGHVYSVLPYLEFSLFRRKTGTLQLKHGTGLALASSTYHPENNPQNRLVSTKLNATSMIDAGYRFFLSRRWDLKAGGMLYHYSNGGLRLPNAGINAASVYLGLAWHPESSRPDRVTHETIRDFKRWRYRLSGSAGFYGSQGENSPDIRIIPQAGAMVFAQHSTSFRTGLGIETGRLNTGNMQLCVYAEEEIQFGKIATRYGLGGYLKNETPGQDRFYSKIGIAYYPETENEIPGKFFFGSMLKAHGAKAAHIELMAGYVF